MNHTKLIKFINPLLILIVFTLFPYAFAQTQFQRVIGGVYGDYANGIIQTSDGNYIIAGTTCSIGSTGCDAYIIKLNNNGIIQWSKTIGGSNAEEIYSLILTSDNGFAMVGISNSFGAGNYDLFVVKLDSNGNFQWNKTIGGPASDFAYCIIQVADGGYAVAGETRSFGAGNRDMYIVKLNPSGDIIWSRTVGEASDDGAQSIIQNIDGDYLIAGYLTTVNYDMSIVKIDANGNLQWCKIISGAGFDNANSILKTNDSGYVVAGYTYSYGAGNDDMYIVKFNKNDTLQWVRTVGGSGYDIAFSITKTIDNGYALAGVTNSFGLGSFDIYITKLNNL